MTDVFQFEDPLARWKREADERTAAEQEERRNRGRAERRAQREAQQSWDEYFRGLIAEEHELMITIVGEALGEQRIDIRDEVREIVDKALREPHWVPRVAGVWKEGEEYGRLNIVSKDGSAWLVVSKVRSDHKASRVRSSLAGPSTENVSGLHPSWPAAALARRSSFADCSRNSSASKMAPSPPRP